MNPNPDNVTFELNQLQLSPEVDDDVEGEEFTFMCRKEKTVVPLFDQSLLYDNEDEKHINEINIKSNSTGFTNPRRLRDNNNNMYRSNSDGRDASVFLNPKMRGKEEEGKKKVKKSTVSALEEYLRRGEEEKRKRGYLTYSKRPQRRGPYGLTWVLYVSVKKSLRAASNILSS
ncbi:hypothetical protein CTI12_AA584200 [Artemisia annua]|uniref:Uncharacterized protein n=1 Tax=Artemisia annua TaxID=35608 RepID=A0A2U1KMT8_ARTAN|nr:hypothetical protein CTI12_AA584200 [Artemisia annua]